MPLVPRPGGGSPGAVGSVDWDGVQDKPEEFPPEAHAHAQGDVSGLTADLSGRYDLAQAVGVDPVCVVSGFGATTDGLELTVAAGTYVDETGRTRSVAEAVLDFTGQANGDYVVSVQDGAVGFASWLLQLPAADELPLFWVVKATSSLTVVETANRLVLPGSEGRTPLAVGPFVSLATIGSGTYANGIKVDHVAGASLDPYFGLPLAWSLAERDTARAKAMVERCLSMWNNVANVAQVPAAYGSTTWQTLHGTTHTGAGDPGGFNPSYWPWRATDPEGTPGIARADSHDSYAAWLVLAAVRIGRVDGAWWDTQWAVLKEIVYYNLVLPLHNVGGGYLTGVFQDSAVYPYCLVGDNCEVWRALAELCRWVTEHNDSGQATWIASNNVDDARDNVGLGLHASWNYDEDPSAEYLNWFYDLTLSEWSGNDHSRYYPEMWVYLMPLLFRAPLYTAAVDARTLFNERVRRFSVCLDRVAEHSPYAGRSGRYNTVFGYSAMWAAAFASIGMFDESRRCSEHWRRQHLQSGQYRYAGSFDLAWILYADDVVGGARPDAMGEWFE